MTHSEGVPLTRELLEALREFATHATRMGGSLALGARQHGEKEALGNFNRATSAAATLKDACAAALASDAGTPEGERVEGWTGKPRPCPNCGAIRNERDAHFCSSTRAASAPLAESGVPPWARPVLEALRTYAGLDPMLDDGFDGARGALVAPSPPRWPLAAARTRGRPSLASSPREDGLLQLTLTDALPIGCGGPPGGPHDG